eukprot:TRINITY_DN97200_c0_g1_i1.p1 TRINITY_DN97200_c0_g1~~TRINITY_DN97200_c0_g1_i1.p1  ORF type:complete len:441 (-),score=74.52 TRINITY_DN97200_c0_g1_i1:174-1496(-)
MSGAPTPTGRTLCGTVSRVGSTFGFIQCPEAKALFEKDVFCPAAALHGFMAGDTVEFDLMVSQRGDPQASNVKRKGEQLASDGQTAFGAISFLGPKFGFIDCPPAKEKFGADVFCPAAMLQGASVGDQVEFELKINEKGQPQAHNARPRGMGKAGQGGPTKFGTITALGDKFGFIHSPPVHAEYGQDVFVPASAIQGASVGEQVEFELVISPKGQPQAHNARPRSMGMLGKGMMGGGVALMSVKGGMGACGGQTLSGTITAILEKFGFIHCPTVKAQYNQDVFVPASALQGASVGDQVEFELMINAKGQPQAQNARPRGMGMAGKGNMLGKFAMSVLGGMAGMAAKGGKAMGSKGKGGASSPTGQKQTGTISAMGGKFGFILCPPVKAQYGQDVFVPASAIQDYSIGDQVEFELVISAKGQPQAHNVTPGQGDMKRRKIF